MTGIRENRDQTNEVRDMGMPGMWKSPAGNSSISPVCVWLKGGYNVLESKIDGLKQICLLIKAKFCLSTYKSEVLEFCYYDYCSY